MTHTPAYIPVPKEELSQRLTRVLDQLSILTENINHVGDELMVQYLVESGELNPDNIADFLNRKDG